MEIGYARVSTTDQSLDLQIDALTKAGCSEEKIYREKKSGSKDDRVELQRALNDLRKGDIFVVYKLDRLARSTVKLIQTLKEVQAKGAEFVCLNGDIDTTTPAGKAMFGMLAVFAEFERDLIVQRTKDGLEAARARGKKGGRPKTDIKKIERAIKLYDAKDHSVADIETMTGIKKATLYRALKQRVVS
ncbi:MAG: recombinase family protein [Paenibacillaceae bacterium]